MKCDDFKDKCGDLSDGEVSAEMRMHMAHCEECAAYYRLMRSLEPKAVPVAPGTLKREVLARAAAKHRKRPAVAVRRIGYAAAAVVLVAAAVWMAVLTGPAEAMASAAQLNSSLRGMDRVENMVMEVKVRTMPAEGFGSIDLEADFTDHILTVLFGDTCRWRLEKAGRTAMCDGRRKYMWLADSRSGVTGPVGSNFEEWFAVLLDPRLVLMKEKEAAEAHEGVRYSVRDEGDEVLLTVRAKARGDFRNDYLFNGSIDESDTRREYRFDSATNLLKGLKVYVLDGRREVLVLEVAAVGYNVLVDEKAVVSLPEGYVWRDVDGRYAAAMYPSDSAEETVVRLFQAFRDLRLDVADGMLAVLYDREGLLERYGGAELMHVGSAFRSGLYPGLFVPVEVVLKDGSRESLCLALRNDNPRRVWIVDGGF